ncbi:amino acid permease [Candidatus Azambacteria bacterium]|nr:amino acid permease [Candidatus Azambacteria bacterium]
MSNNFISAIAILIGTIVGVGIFALPYAVTQVGFTIGFLYLVGLTIIVTFLHLAFGEIILRTSGDHRLPGYTRIYLGEIMEKLVNTSTIIGISLILLIYIMVGGEFLSKVIPNNLNISYFHLLFWLIMSLFIVVGLKTIKVAEFLMTLFLIIIVALALGLNLNQINLGNLTSFNIKNIFFPYGIILFALLGTSVIGQVTKILKNEKPKIKSAIVWGTAISAIVYLIFIITMVGVMGSNSPKMAMTAFQNLFPSSLFFLIAIFGTFLIATSYLTLGFYFKETLLYDFKLNRFLVLGIVTLLF